MEDAYLVAMLAGYGRAFKQGQVAAFSALVYAKG